MFPKGQEGIKDLVPSVVSWGGDGPFSGRGLMGGFYVISGVALKSMVGPATLLALLLPGHEMNYFLSLCVSVTAPLRVPKASEASTSWVGNFKTDPKLICSCCMLMMPAVLLK